MFSELVDRAIEEARESGRALLKFISANDAGATGSHQNGLYLPKQSYQLFTPDKPEEGINSKHEVEITWPNGLKTDSVVTWYGVKSRSEYRLTRFGRGFPYLQPNSVGDLIVLIPETLSEFHAFVFDLEADIEDVQAALGVMVTDGWAIYQEVVQQDVIEKADQHPAENAKETALRDCAMRLAREFAAELNEFPSGEKFSQQTWKIASECSGTFSTASADAKLSTLVDQEYRLFQHVEQKLCEPLIQREFESVDQFLKTAASIMNRRKSRAGRSLENHLESVFNQANIPFEMRVDEIQGKPDIVIPGQAAYLDAEFPDKKIFIVGVKTTCKDRWRQVLNEGPRIRQKYLITLQQGISENQLNEMHDSQVQLVVPRRFHSLYPKTSKMKLMTLDGFIEIVAERSK